MLLIHNNTSQLDLLLIFCKIYFVTSNTQIISDLKYRDNYINLKASGMYLFHIIVFKCFNASFSVTFFSYCSTHVPERKLFILLRNTTLLFVCELFLYNVILVQHGGKQLEINRKRWWYQYSDVIQVTDTQCN